MPALSSRVLEDALRAAGAAAPGIIRATAPAGPFGNILVEALCRENGQIRSGLRWARLLLASYLDAGGAGDAPIEACVGLECVMAAADIFDEIQDGDPSPLSDKHGAPRASNAAAALLVIGLELLNRTDRSDHDRETSRSAQSVGAIAAGGLLTASAGQHQDLSIQARRDESASPLRNAEAKSAALTRMTCIIGATLARAHAACVEPIGHIGHLLGMAAQLRNDARGHMVPRSTKRSSDDDGSGSITQVLTLWAMSERFASEALTAARAAHAPNLAAIAESPHRRASEGIVAEHDVEHRPLATLVR